MNGHIYCPFAEYLFRFSFIESNNLLCVSFSFQSETNPSYYILFWMSLSCAPSFVVLVSSGQAPQPLQTMVVISGSGLVHK